MYMAAFEGLMENQELITLDIILEVIFALNIVLEFFVEYEDIHTRKKITKITQTSLHYLKG